MKAFTERALFPLQGQNNDKVAEGKTTVAEPQPAEVGGAVAAAVNGFAAEAEAEAATVAQKAVSSGDSDVSTSAAASTAEGKPIQEQSRLQESEGAGEGDGASSATAAAENASSEQPVDRRASDDPATSRSQEPQKPAGPDYARFREMLKHASAQPVNYKLLDFVRKFTGNLSREEAAKRVHKFLGHLQEWMLAEVVVFAADADEEGQTNAAEGLEKFLVSRLHSKIFAVDPEDKAEDARLQEQIGSLSWVSFEHLGVPPVDPSLLMVAADELRSVDKYKAPHDKLVCILNATRVINDVLKRTLKEQGAVGRPLSADDFLPLLIYCVLQANPPRLHSNVEYIAAFRHPSRLVAEEAYYLTALQSAAAFAKDANPQTLEVSEEEFTRRCAAALEAFREKQAEEARREAARSAEEALGWADPPKGPKPGAQQPPGAANSKDDALASELEAAATAVSDAVADAAKAAAWFIAGHPSRDQAGEPGDGSAPDLIPMEDFGASEGKAADGSAPQSPRTVHQKAAALDVETQQALAEKVRALPFAFETVFSAKDLRMADVPKLLSEYQEMARLLRALEGGQAASSDEEGLAPATSEEERLALGSSENAPATPANTPAALADAAPATTS